MGFRFYRRLSIIPGVRLNVGTRGTSVSFGHRGAWYTVGPHGRRTATLGWPGSGLRYTTTTTSSSTSTRQGAPPAPSALAWLVWLAIAVVAIRMLLRVG